ncbi:MAG: hypothetical protein WBC74_00625 [Candidatus Omnitrophota bacterium]
MKKFILAVLIFTLLGAPAYSQDFSKEPAAAEEKAPGLKKDFRANIVINKSIEEDVLKILGEPHIRTTLDYTNFELSGIPFVKGSKIVAKETWTYIDLSDKAAWKRDNAVLTLGGVIFSRNVKLINVFFDKNGKVIGYQFDETVN